MKMRGVSNKKVSDYNKLILAVVLSIVLIVLVVFLFSLFPKKVYLSGESAGPYGTCGATFDSQTELGLTWDPSPDSRTDGYKLYYGNLPRPADCRHYGTNLPDCAVYDYNYETSAIGGWIQTPTGRRVYTPDGTLAYLLVEQTKPWFFAVVATSSSYGIESDFSNELPINSNLLPVISSSNLPEGVINQPYSGFLSASSGIPPYTWSVTSGNLPPGLSLDPSNGIISGTPTSSLSSSFRAVATDSNSVSSSSSSFTIDIAPTAASGNLQIPVSTLPSGTVNVNYNYGIMVQGGTSPYNWRLLSGNLPNGLTLSQNGIIRGKPTVQGVSNFRLVVSDSSQVEILTAQKDMSLLIYPAGTPGENNAQTKVISCNLNGAYGASMQTYTIRYSTPDMGSGAKCYLIYATDLNGPWTDLKEVQMGTNQETTVDVPVENSAGFFRLRLESSLFGAGG